MFETEVLLPTGLLLIYRGGRLWSAAALAAAFTLGAIAKIKLDRPSESPLSARAAGPASRHAIFAASRRVKAAARAAALQSPHPAQVDTESPLQTEANTHRTPNSIGAGVALARRRSTPHPLGQSLAADCVAVMAFLGGGEEK